MTSAAMTTAVQPTELVFEFASNGMDEINQVSITLEKLHFEILNPVVCCLYARLGLLSVFFFNLIKSPLDHCLTIHLFFSSRQTVILLINVRFFHSRANKTCLNSMVTRIGLAVAQSL